MAKFIDGKTYTVLTKTVFLSKIAEGISCFGFHKSGATAVIVHEFKHETNLENFNGLPLTQEEKDTIYARVDALPEGTHILLDE